MNQALDFYSPVEDSLRGKLAPIFGLKAKETLEKEFAFTISYNTGKAICECFGRQYAEDQFYKIIEFMSGRRPDTCPPGKEDEPGDVKCMILIYEGVNAVQKIRDVLGPTDPLKAPGGTVRRGVFRTSARVPCRLSPPNVGQIQKTPACESIREPVFLFFIYLRSAGSSIARACA